MPGSRNVFGRSPSPPRVNRLKRLYHFPCGTSGSDASQPCNSSKSAIEVRPSRKRNAKWSMIQFALQRTQTSFDVTEVLAVSELRECHRQIMIPAREASAMMIAAVARHALLELLVGKMRDQFREHRFKSFQVVGTPVNSLQVR